MNVQGTNGTRTHVLGVPVDVLTVPELMQRVGKFAADAGPHLVCYVNAECLNQAAFDRRYRAILHEADLVYADGMAVVWASRLTGQPLANRITMADALPELCRVAVQQRLRVFLLGGAPGVAKRAAAKLKRDHSKLQIVGAYHGYFSAERDADVVAQINRARPHILLVGMGAPKQEKWIWRHRGALKVPVLWGVGALFDYYGGKTPRAPGWMGRFGFEWFFRLLVEPRRLWRRYLLGNVFFVVRVCALLLVDAGLVTVAWLGAYAIRVALNPVFGFAINPIEGYIRALPLIVGVWVLNCATFGLYRRTAAMSVIAELAQVIRATWLGLLITIAAAFIFKEFDFGRSVVLLVGALMFVLLTSSRLIARGIERRLARRGIGLRRTLIVGTGSLAQRVKEEIEIWPVGYDVVGFVADGAGDEPPRGTVIGTVSGLGRIIRHRRIQEVFVASENLALHEQLNLLATQERWPVNFHVITEHLEEFSQRVPIDRVIELPLLQLPHTRTNPWYEVTKRLADVVVATIGLVLILPLLALISAAVKLESPGPVLFRQRRVGRHGRMFDMIKFRTMRTGTDAYAMAPNALRDPRVTRLGRFLRRWSLDELPQLINVFIGDMSVVGPRPEMSFLVKQYQPWQRRRLTVRPGITGLWQVVGRKELPLHRNMEYDLYYIRHRGWLLDSAIVLRTIPAVLFHRGAF